MSRSSQWTSVTASPTCHRDACDEAQGTCRACGICLCCGDHADDYPCCACGNDRVTLTCAYVYGLADGGAPGNGNVSAQGSCSLRPLLRVSINFLTLQSCQAKVALMITLAPRTNTALVHILVAACRQVAAAVSYICL